MEERKSNYYDQVNYLNSINVKEIIQSEQILTNLLTSSEDRHIISTLMELVNQGIKSGEIESQDLGLLRTGFLTDQILNLKNLTAQRGRNLFPFEIGDKLNYLSIIQDVETLNATYANENLINAINSNPNSELSHWITSGTIYSLPTETKVNVAQTILKTENIELATRILDMVSKDMQRSRENEIENSKTR